MGGCHMRPESAQVALLAKVLAFLLVRALPIAAINDGSTSTIVRV